MIATASDPVLAADTDDTPSLQSQAESKGWTAGLFSFNKADSPLVAHFNPGLIQRPDGLWLLVRRAVFTPTDAFGMNSIWACQLNPDLTPHGGPLLKYPNAAELEQFEDPRFIWHEGRAWGMCCNFIWYGNGEWTGAHQTLSVWDGEWNCIKRYAPKIGGNNDDVTIRGAKMEKNWLPFFHEGKLVILYHSKPWRMAMFGKDVEDITPFELDTGPEVSFGEIRGGTPPVLVDGLYWTFWHSSVPWIGRFRRYHMGAMAFESKPPFKPVLVTKQPLLTGSQKDPWAPKKPLVVFPGGSVLRNGKWLIVYGVNDLRCGWCEIPHADIVKLCEPVGELTNDPIRLASKSSGGDDGKPTTAGSVTPQAQLLAHRPCVEGVTRPSALGATTACSGGNETGGVEGRGESPSAPSRIPMTCINGNGETEMVYITPMPGEPTLSDRIRSHVKALADLTEDKPGRYAMILTELRKQGLAPRAAKRK